MKIQKKYQLLKSKSTHNKWFTLFFIMLLVLQSCGNDKEQKEIVKPAKIPFVKVQVVEEIDLVSSIEITGTIEANIYTDIVATADGVIQNLMVRENQTVSKNSIVAIINPNDRVSIISKNSISTNELATKIKKADKGSLDYKNLKNELDQANKNLEYAKNMYKTIPVVCPMSGLVTQRWTETGNQVNAKDKILTISDMNSLVIKSEINEKYFESLKKGNEIVLKLNAYPNDTLKGIISLIYPQIDPITRNIKFNIKIQNFKKTLIPGMLASIQIPVASKKNAITIPEQAVLTSPNNENFIFIIDKDSLVHKIIVEKGMQTGNNLEILKGLQAKDKVVISGQEMLKDSIKVKVLKK